MHESNTAIQFSDQPFALFQSLEKHTMRGLCDRLRQHVLLLAGERDHYIPQGQYGILMQEITSAHTLTGRMFSSQEGGEQHCQVGNHMIAISTILDWLRDTVWPK